MNKYLLLLGLLSPVILFAQQKKKKDKGPKTFDLIVGGYSGDNNKGISVYRFYAETGRLAYLSQSDDIPNPSYLCVDKNSNFVYAVSEVGKNDEVSAFKLAPKTGILTFVNKQQTKGAASCFVSVDKDSKNLFVANYSSGNLTVLPLAKDGSILPLSQQLQEKGTGVNKERQEGPHVHQAFISPDEKYVIHTDLGNDKLHVSRYKSGHTQPLVPEATVSVKPGSGPRHIDFSPDKKHVYLVQELTADVTVFDYDNGKLTQKQSVTMLPDGFKGDVGAADIHVSPNGKFLYASNRGDANDIVVYSIAPETGLLTFVDRKSSGGKGPRNFVIDPAGKFLLAANQGTNNIVVFKIDQQTGKLWETSNRVTTDKPTCLKFASAVEED